jgi:hypothetical protein
MLLPALNRAKLKAETTVCQNNLKQLQLGTNLYVQQYGSYMSVNSRLAGLRPFVRSDWPTNNYDVFNYGGGTYGLRYLGPGTGIYACPAYNRLKGMFERDGVSDYGGWGSYGYNDNGCGLRNGGLGGYFGLPAVPPATESQVLCPSDMISWTDATLLSSPVQFDPGEIIISGDIDYYYVDPDSGNLNSENFALVLEGKLRSRYPWWGVQAMNQRHNGRWMVASEVWFAAQQERSSPDCEIEGIHANRASRGRRHHRYPGSDAASCFEPSEK